MPTLRNNPRLAGVPLPPVGGRLGANQSPHRLAGNASRQDVVHTRVALPGEPRPQLEDGWPRPLAPRAPATAPSACQWVPLGSNSTTSSAPGPCSGTQRAAAKPSSAEARPGTSTSQSTAGHCHRSLSSTTVPSDTRTSTMSTGGSPRPSSSWARCSFGYARHP